MTEYITLAQAAALHNLSRVTLYRWCTADPPRIPGIIREQAGKRAYLIPADWIPPPRVRAGWPKGRPRPEQRRASH